ncbi:MAG: copper chaperone PCu(A)C [Gammaproteobacteria bacterium]|jgi:copper(I)-binding protein|nr:copper chaperone PCu(A)C [Gammaproteobacteria bacterium]
MKQKTLTVLILLISGFINPLYADEAGITVENAWIAEAPPVSKVMVAYMTINNTGNEAIDLTNAESDLYSSIEFHETIHEDGMARMVRWGKLTIPANGSIELKRGGKHFMLFNPTKHLKAGDTVNIKLTTNNNKTKTISVTVEKAQY